MAGAVVRTAVAVGLSALLAAHSASAQTVVTAMGDGVNGEVYCMVTDGVRYV
jgi:hypothetical protein